MPLIDRPKVQGERVSGNGNENPGPAQFRCRQSMGPQQDRWRTFESCNFGVVEVKGNEVVKPAEPRNARSLICYDCVFYNFKGESQREFQ
mgnify:CR=1 FL=1